MTTEPHALSDAPLDPVEGLVAICLDSPPDERPTTLDRLCADHPDLAGELRRRLDVLDQTLVGLRPSQAELPEQLGDFRLMRALGGGGMGVVHEAEQLSLGRVVALKLIRPEQLWFPRARERFRRESEAVAALQHPGIVPVHAVGEEHGVPYLAMERFEGSTLAEALRALARRAPESLSATDLRQVVEQAAGRPAADEAIFRGSWTEACVEIVRRVAEALEHAHGRGIVHRDVKPSNVALSIDGRVLLFDFGLMLDDSNGERVTRTGAFMGTLPYMAPEQLSDARSAGPRSDVYSLGVTLYELLTLQLPFGDENATTQARILEGRPDPIRTRNRRVPEDLETACLVAMDVDPARRYPSATAFARDLGKLQARRPIEARAPGLLLRARRWVQRHPAAATAAVLGTALLLGIPSALFWQERADSRRVKAAYARLSDALEQESLARAAETQARDMAVRSLEFVVDLFEDVAPDRRPGPLATSIDMLRQGARDVGTDLAAHPNARGRVRSALGGLLVSYGHYEEAVPVLEHALVDFEQAGDPTLRWLVSQTRLSLSQAVDHTGDPIRAEALLRDEVAWAKASGDEQTLRLALMRLAATLGRPGQEDEADAIYVELMPLLEGEHPQAALRGNMLLNHGLTLERRGRQAEAEARIREGIAVNEALFEPPHEQLTLGRFYLANLLDDLGPEQRAEAEALYLQCIDEATTIWGEQHIFVCLGHARLGRLVSERGGDLALAEEHARRGLALTRASIGSAPGTAYAALNLGVILVRREQFREAGSVLDEVLAHERDRGGLDPGHVGSAWYERGRAHEGLAQLDDAARCFGEALRRWESDGGPAERVAMAADALARVRAD